MPVAFSSVTLLVEPQWPNQLAAVAPRTPQLVLLDDDPHREVP